MSKGRTIIHQSPRLKQPRMLLSFSGWMDGGEVSTGTIRYICDKINAQPLAAIESDDFYIQNFPGTMEISALLRPYAKVEKGILVDYKSPSNNFYYSEEHNVILFIGTEPHIKWTEYSDAIFEVVDHFDVSRTYFVGSVGGAVPHTRQPKVQATVSDDSLKNGLQQLGFQFGNYEGPVGISTWLTRYARERNASMISLIAEIPPYVQGKNPRCIETMTKIICGLLVIHLDRAELVKMGDELESKLNAAILKHPDLQERITQLEDSFDREIFDDRMGDMKQWLTERGIILD